MVWLVILFAVLQALDAYLTIRVLANGGREMNPIVAWFMHKLGKIPALVALKAFGVIVVSLFALSGNEYADDFLMVSCALYAGVVAWNYQQLRNQ